MGTHINSEGKFQSDKYPTCPADKVPLSVNDPDAQPLLWIYAELHRKRDNELSDDLQARLRAVGFDPRGVLKIAIDTLRRLFVRGPCGKVECDPQGLCDECASALGYTKR